MQHVVGDQVRDFASIFDKDVEIVSVTRSQADARSALSRRLLLSRQVPELRWVQPAGDPDATDRALPVTIDVDARATLCDEIGEASEMLGYLLDCEDVGVRLATLNRPMCPRFHVDQIPCRMLITLSGEGTEWIQNGDVDWEIFDDLDTQASPVQSNRSVQRLSAGQWSLLKGGTWQDGFRGVVHRSPHDVGERLLLTLDPVF